MPREIPLGGVGRGAAIIARAVLSLVVTAWIIECSVGVVGKSGSGFALRSTSSAVILVWPRALGGGEDLSARARAKSIAAKRLLGEKPGERGPDRREQSAGFPADVPVTQPSATSSLGGGVGRCVVMGDWESGALSSFEAVSVVRA